MSMPEREPRFCRCCGKKLISWYYYTGRCATCFTPNDQNLINDARAAKERGLSYGKYIALRREGLIKD